MRSPGILRASLPTYVPLPFLGLPYTRTVNCRGETDGVSDGSMPRHASPMNAYLCRLGRNVQIAARSLGCRKGMVRQSDLERAVEAREESEGR